MPDFGEHETRLEGTPRIKTNHSPMAAILTTLTPLFRLQSPIFPSECGIATYLTAAKTLDFRQITQITQYVQSS